MPPELESGDYRGGQNAERPDHVRPLLAVRSRAVLMSWGQRRVLCDVHDKIDRERQTHRVWTDEAS